jgi:hypothetical protein
MAVSWRIQISAWVALAAISCGQDRAPAAPEPRAPGQARTEKICSFAQGSVTLGAACGCTRVEGDLALDAGSAGDLGCLRELREVTGKLAISARMSSSWLTNLRGLDGLRSVRALSLTGLSVTDLTALSNLQSAGELQLRGLPRIQDLRGLEHVAWTQLTLEGNAALRSLDGLHVPQVITALSVRENPQLETLEQLRSMRAADSIELEHLAALATLEGLDGEIDRFRLTQCDNLVDLRGLRANIRAFALENNTRLRSLEGFVGLSAQPGAGSGPEVLIDTQPELESLDGLFRSDHGAIARLQLLGLPKIEAIDLRSPSALGALVVRTCTALREIRGVESIETIAQLHLTGLTALPRLPAFDALRHIGDLELIELSRVADLAPLSSLTSADRTSLSLMDSLSSLHGLEQLSRAGRLLIEDLLALESLEGLRGLQNVDTLWIQGDDKLESLRGLTLKSARELAVRYNDALKTLDGLDKLGEISTLDISENPALVSIRALASLHTPGKIFARANRSLSQCELDRLAARLPAGSTHEFSENGPAAACPTTR